MAVISLAAPGEQDDHDPLGLNGSARPPQDDATIPAIHEDLDDEETLDGTREKCVHVFNSYRDDDRRRFHARRWGAIYRAYHGIRPINQGPYRQNYFRRVIFRMIETIKPLIIEQFMPGEDLFRYLPEHPGEEDAKAAATRIVHKQIRSARSGRSIELELIKWLEGGIMWGTSYLTTGWSQFKFTRRKIRMLHEDVDDLDKAWDRETEEQESGCPYAEQLNPWELFCHAEIDDPRRSPAVFIQKVCTVSDLWTLVREGWLDEDRTQAAADDIAAGQCIYPNEIDVDFTRPEFAMLYNVNTEDSINDSLHELLVCWTNNGWEYVILDRKHILRAQRLRDGRMPLHCLRNYPQAGEHWGISEVIPVLEEQRLLNDFTSMYVDSFKLCSTPMVLCKDGTAEKAWVGANIRPGASIKLSGDMDAIKPFVMPPLPDGQREMLDDIDRSMTITTGITPELGGTGSNANTATGQVHLEQAASKRIEHKIRLFTPEWRNVMRDFYYLNAAFLDEEVKIRYEGEDGITAFAAHGPEVFAADECEVELQNNPQFTMEEVNAAIQCAQLFMNNPMVNQMRLIEDVFRTRGKPKPKIYLNNPATAPADALTENRDWFGTGIVVDPNPNDDHQTHLQIHQMAFQQFANNPQVPPGALAAMQRHMNLHQCYMAFAQKQAAMQAQQGPAPGQSGGPGQIPGKPPRPQGDVKNAANARTEATMKNGMRGAGQQGKLPGPPGPGKLAG